ncbi:MAG: hypothetical protein WAS05_01380 [Candidatus Nanopelagicales bacterium]
MNEHIEPTNEKSVAVGTRLISKVVLAGSALVLGVGLAACGGSSDSSSTPSAASSEVPTQASAGDNLTAGKLPADWPSDVPQPPYTTVEGGAGSNGSFSASFNGSGSLDSELTTYFSELESNGWTQDKTVDTGNKLTGWNKDNRRTQVIAQDNGDGTYAINVTVVTKN